MQRFWLHISDHPPPSTDPNSAKQNIKVTDHTGTHPCSVFDEAACFTIEFLHNVASIMLPASWEQSRILLFSNHTIGLQMFKKRMADNVSSQSHYALWWHLWDKSNIIASNV